MALLAKFSQVAHKLRSGSFVFSASVVNALVNAGLSILLVRAMPADQYGSFSSALAVMTMVAQLVDALFNTGMVTLAAQAYTSGMSDRGQMILDGPFWLKLAVGGLITLLSVTFAVPLSPFVFGEQGYGWVVPLVFLGALGQMLISHQQSDLQSRRSFRNLALNSILITAAKVGVVMMGLTVWRTTPPLIAVYSGAALLGALIGFSFTRPRRIWSRVHVPVVRELLGLGRWIAASSVIVSITLRIDILMLNNLTTRTEVAEYAAANQLAYFFPIINNTVSTVLLPEVATYKGTEQLRKYVGSVLKMAPLVGALCFISVLAAKYVVPLVLGEQYATAISTFSLLSIAYCISLLVNPLSLPFYSTGRPQIMTAMNVVQLVVGAVVNYLLIPIAGASGAAWGTLSVRILALLWVTVGLQRLLRDGK